MGIQYLNTYMKKKATTKSIVKTKLNELENKIVVIDTSIYLYRFISENNLIENMYLMIALFKYYKIIPIFVFDGKPPKEKFNIINKRNNDKKIAEIKYNELQKEITQVLDPDKKKDITETINSLKKKFTRVKYNDIVNVHNLLDAFGVYYIQALGEADELCAKLVIKKYAYACLSEDMDLFLYGCPRVMRYLSLVNETVILYHLDKILIDLDLSFEEFKQICILSGTDYNYNSTKNINLYNILDYFEKYKEYLKNNNNKLDFYDWIDQNYKVIDNIYELYNTYLMFETNQIELPKLKKINLIKQSNDIKIKEIMKPHGFIFLD